MLNMCGEVKEGMAEGEAFSFFGPVADRGWRVAGKARGPSVFGKATAKLSLLVESPLFPPCSRNVNDERCLRI